jgi:short subunit dehydrogenase-like uncharacterized protein
MNRSSREYDIEALKAYGYAASIVCEYISERLPTSLDWAVGGRSERKLEASVNKLISVNGDRQAPGKSVPLPDIRPKH